MTATTTNANGEAHTATATAQSDQLQPLPPPTTSTALARPRMSEEDFRMALEPASFNDVGKLAGFIAKSGMFKVKSMEDALVRIMTGRALGLPMFASLKGIYSIEGSVGLEARLKVAICNQRPDCEYFYCEERSATKSTWVAKRRGRPNEQRLTFTIEEATAAGLIDRGATPDKQKMNNWNRWPADMCSARASGKLADLVWPEAALGLQTREEIEDERAGAITTTGETMPDVPLAPAHAAPQRDFASEAALLKQRIHDAAGKPKEEKAAIRTAVAKFLEEADPEIANDVRAYYNLTIGTKPAASTGGQP